MGFLSVINFCSALATIFSKATTGVLVGLLLFFIGVFLPTFYDYQDGEAGLISLISLHPIAAFAYGMQEIGDLEDKGVGVTSNTWDTSDHPSGYTFQDTLTFLIRNVIFWGVLGGYLTRVIKPAYGQALPFYFPFMSSYWCPGASKHEEVGDEEIEYDDDIPVEPVGESLRRQAREGKSIEIRNLEKTFGEKRAVDDLNLSMYSGQITALLGHNGAGKTTTIGMLTGALAPTSGTAIVAGKDVKSQLSEIREDIGICLQHDCLFPLLTVKEHIQFFSRVKGLYQNKSKSEAEDMIDQAMRDVALHEKRNTQSRKLSGGMKRKLSVAIAFCGGSKVVLLDEPTSGMDPFSRRFTWNVIRQYRQDRCIILTTHFMDEADILGDRIAIMAEGQLRCCGSSLFLKNHYGVGYQLTIERNHEDSDDGRKKKLKEIVTGNVEGAVLLSDVGTELSFQLPVGAASQFTPMFEGLDKEIDEGVVSTYGVSITTLDEVFLLVARGGSAEKKEAYKSSTRISGTATVEADEAEKSARSRMDLEKSNLFNTHVGSMFRKRAAFFRRDKKAWCCTTILPSLFVLFGFVIFRISEGDETYGALKLSLDDFNEDIKEGPRNPVIFNEANSSYTCWSGECAYTPVIESSVTNEKYMYNGVLTIQRLVGDYIIAKTGAANDGFGVAEAGVRYVHFPTAEYEEQGFFSEIGGYGPILICLGLMYPAASIIGFITREKELRQKELMKMMSITEAEIGWSWFTSFFLLHLINVILCTVVSGVLYESTENLFLFMYWLFTFLSVINFCSALATIFSKATTGVLVGLLLFFIGVFLPTFYDYQDGEAGLISLISLRPIAAFAYGMQEIGDLEDKGVGVTSNTWDTS